ncbi:NAD(P)H-binding protein [Paractinoplanes atraurantiacus]|uniref:Nucleoside-diphosphate-sugar epimerase n=1 Tax=Paractinoplanes atraurantiacus TaxID=1036182 RepID=A0A285J409_9ACTN|nr:NAD(P)H-binding protein [Actinoplanes atraurantiacus]SNY55090.1 Nucleoside-diphosphate-sugar epimerase [Actinoplanes atraurantiacus]
MRVFVIGAAGGVGRRLSKLLTGQGDDVTGMHRGADQAEAVAASGARPLLGDLVHDTVDELALRFQWHDAVVFSAGAHGTGRDQTTLIDGKGLEKAAEAAGLAGVRRFLLVSVFPEAGRSREPTEGFEHYMRVKKQADVLLSRSGLDWVIVRPGTLVDNAGEGRVTAGPAVSYGDTRRDDVAAFLAAVLHEPRLNRVIVEVTSGDEPVADAVRRLASG